MCEMCVPCVWLTHMLSLTGAFKNMEPTYRKFPSQNFKSTDLLNSLRQRFGEHAKPVYEISAVCSAVSIAKLMSKQVSRVVLLTENN